jgi:hypothetical protein
MTIKQKGTSQKLLDHQIRENVPYNLHSKTRQLMRNVTTTVDFLTMYKLSDKITTCMAL